MPNDPTTAPRQSYGSTSHAQSAAAKSAAAAEFGSPPRLDSDAATDEDVPVKSSPPVWLLLTLLIVLPLLTVNK